MRRIVIGKMYLLLCLSQTLEHHLGTTVSGPCGTSANGRAGGEEPSVRAHEGVDAVASLLWFACQMPSDQLCT